MNVGLYRGVAAIQASERRLETITSNLANLGTTGFKRRGAVQHGFAVGKPGLGFEGVGASTRVDFSQGSLERTGNPLDLALNGDGFFAAEGPQGEVFTRNGSLQFDGQGVLTTTEGYPVAWDGGRGNIDPAGGAITVDLEGGVHQDNARIGRLKIRSFPAADRLQPLESGYWRAGPALLADSSNAEVHQGALERPNVSAVDELVRLITVQRDFEAASKVVRMIDQSYERLNNLR
ncbi:MAG: flagellar hook basal-body protein [bacterium]|nr:flagellar hook basal-body protein [bacterium]